MDKACKSNGCISQRFDAVQSVKVLSMKVDVFALLSNLVLSTF
ncbi:MAG: hypothetical protein CEO12_587 [Parcubacteria group bacterium Gr01-1014_46]|nr:MAG: hypothetical protein CEO12_587 [Parcubacteria group bacterium Gr01-1014_46]